MFHTCTPPHSSLQNKKRSQCTTDFITLPTSNRIFFLIFNFTHTLLNSLQTLFKICASFSHTAPLSRVILCVRYNNLHECHSFFFVLSFLFPLMFRLELSNEHTFSWYWKHTSRYMQHLLNFKSRACMLEYSKHQQQNRFGEYPNLMHTKFKKTKRNQRKRNKTLWNQDYKVSSERWKLIKCWMQ